MCFAACSILSLQRELMAEMESGQQPEDPNSLPLSQERLICKAASLSYFLINEVAVAPVSPVLVILQVCSAKEEKCLILSISRSFSFIRFFAIENRLLFIW